MIKTRTGRRPTPIKFGLGLVVLLVGLLAFTNPAAAQRGPGTSVGLGGQIGDPSGITLKLWNPTGWSYDFMAAWDTGDFFFLNVHGLLEQHVNGNGNVHVFYGPGAYIGVRDRPHERDDDSVFGISAEVGLGVLLQQFEIYGQLIPRLDLTPATDGDIGAGIGVRYYF